MPSSPLLPTPTGHTPFQVLWKEQSWSNKELLLLPVTEATAGCKGWHLTRKTPAYHPSLILEIGTLRGWTAWRQALNTEKDHTGQELELLSLWAKGLKRRYNKVEKAYTQMEAQLEKHILPHRMEGHGVRFFRGLSSLWPQIMDV